MKHVGRTSPNLWAGALALFLSGPGALAQARPGAPAPPPAPAAAVRPPDLAFKEVQVFYPAFNLGIRLVPPGSPVQTSVLRLIENPAVAPGTKLGPDEANGQPGPIATRACGEPLRASVRLWVTNSGVAPFDATTAALGLTGTVASQTVSSAFGKIAGGQTVNFETGALNLVAGSYSAVLALNTAHGGGETNFANNGFESRFQITCGCPAGQVRDAASGKCVAPPGTPCPPGTVRNAAGQCVSTPTATLTPAGRNPLAGPTTGPTATPAPARTTGSGVVPSARLAAPATVTAVPPTPTRPPLGAARVGGNTTVDPCTVPGAPAHVLGAVNNRTSGIVFSPAGSYHITGCGFGSQRGTATLRVRTTSGQTLEFDLTPKPGAWAPNAIDATLAADISGVADTQSATVVIKGNDGVEVSQEGHGFRAARERVMLTSARKSWYTPAKNPWGIGAFGQPTSNDKATQFVSGGSVVDGSCQGWSSSGYQDRWTVPPADLKPGFVLDSIEVVDDVKTPNSDNDSTQTTNFGKFGVRSQGGTTYVQLHGLSVYTKAVGLISGSSSCTYRYHVRNWVIGPRGVPPM